jgi:GT2 family glycosyltransferase
MKIAVLLTTYNRKQKTFACLKNLRRQKLPAGVEIEIFLTDDMSPDGTPKMISHFFPEVHLYNGNGSLFWAGGMRKTWKHALNSDAEYFLLLNDDTILYEHAIEVLVTSIRATNNHSICIGSTMDKDTGKISYGGRRLTSHRLWDSYFVFSEDEYKQCDFGNANIMFVPRPVVNKIGILSGDYTHSLADYDYALRAKKAGFSVLVAPGFLGTCTDDHGNNWLSQKTSLQQRINYLKSPKGLAYKEFLHFIRNHFPLSYPAVFCKLWLKTFFPFVWEIFKRKNFADNLATMKF